MRSTPRAASAAALVAAVLIGSARGAHLVCPADVEVTPDSQAEQLKLEEYFVGHGGLPFFAPVDKFLDETAGGLGLQSNQFRYILGLFAMFPLALLLRVLPGPPVLKHMFTLVCGLAASLYCFGSNTLVPLGTSVLIFVLLKATFGRDTDEKYVTSKHVPVAYFSLMLAILSGIHIHRLYIDYGGYTLDVSGPQMIVTIKLCQVVWNVYDFRNRNSKFPHRDRVGGGWVGAWLKGTCDVCFTVSCVAAGRWRFVLCCAVPCCAVLCCAVLCCAVLCTCVRVLTN